MAHMDFLMTLITALTDSEIRLLCGAYTDGSYASAYAGNNIATCLETGIITDSSDTTISPKADITRGAVADSSAAS